MNAARDTSPLRVAFFGTPGFAVPTLEHLVRSHHRVVGVVTQPDRPRGRGQRPAASPVKQVAEARGLPVLQPDDVKQPGFVEAFQAWDLEVGVVAAYGHILPASLLARPRYGMINVHASLLPKYRGAAPVQRAVMAGERETGITIMRVVRALDAGPVLAALAVPIGPDRTSADIERELAFLGAPLLVSVLDDLAAGSVVETPQDDREATYAARLTKADGIIDWGRPAVQIHNQVRGLHPWPHAFTYLDGARYIVLRSRAEPAAVDRAEAGRILEAAGDRLLVACGGGTALAIVEIQTEGRRAQSVRDFLSGHRLQAGQRFTGPPSGS